MTAVTWLRRRTLARATRGYLVWIGRAVGWTTIAYLLFWVVVFATAGVQSLPRADAPPAGPWAAVAGAIAALAFLALTAAGRTPPVVLDRRDLYRLGLAPTAPYEVLRLRLDERRLLRVAVAGGVGAVWSLVAPPLFLIDAPWAAPALALLAVAHADVTWLRYAGFRRPGAEGRAVRRAAAAAIAAAAGLAALGLLDGVLPGAARFGLAAAGTTAHPGALLAPAALALAAHAAVRRSLRSSWPPRFAAQSLVLTQLQAMRTLRLLAGVAGMASGGEAEATERERLLAALHDRPGATRPRRSLRPPALGQPVGRALAWRAALALHRRPRAVQLQLLVLAVGAGAAAWAAAPALVAAPPPVAVGPTTVDVAAAGDPLGATIVAAVGVLAAAWLWARAGAALLGPALPRGTAPIEPLERTRGRLTVPFAVLAAAALPGYGVWVLLRGALTGGAAGPDLLLAGVALTLLLLTVLVALEKYATWTGTSASSWEPTLVAALVATLPGLLLGLFGVPEAALPVQLAWFLILRWLPI
jgi:hypothetical protein